MLSSVEISGKCRTCPVRKKKMGFKMILFGGKEIGLGEWGKDR